MTVQTPTARAITHCRFCGGALSIPFCDLGPQPLANSYVRPERAGIPDALYPLAVRVCEECRLAQLDHVVDSRAIFSDYAYLSSVSSTWVEHAGRFVWEAIDRFDLGRGSFVVEVASNDGYLLHHAVEAGLRCLGIEPAVNVAVHAQARGVPTLIRFFGAALAADIVEEFGPVDLVVANNVLAHVPDINDFAAGLAILAGNQGVVSIETPHLARLMADVQFDTIYHEHYAYWSLLAAERVLASKGLFVFDVERLPTHGGSLRILASADGRERGPGCTLVAVRQEEAELGLDTDEGYAGFEPRMRAVIDAFLSWLSLARAEGRSIAAYGAAAKGNTFLNAARVTAADIPVVADASPAKQGLLLPGSRIPVVTPDALLASKPQDILILPWNLADEIADDLAEARRWGARFVTAIPALRTWPARR